MCECVCVCVHTLQCPLFTASYWVYFHHLPNFGLLSQLDERFTGRERAAELIASV